MLALDILKQICHIPTASFYEEKIRNKLLTICKKLFEDKVTITEDKYGNVIVHYKGDPNRDNPKSIAYVAHIDHPAFHIENNLLRMMGGLNSEVVVGCPVTLISKDHSQKEKTKITETIKDGEKIKYRTGKEDLSKFAFAILDLPELTTINNVIKAPVLDDLAGVAMSLAALKEIVDNKTKSDVYVVLHIAEEVGLIGAYLIAKQKLLPKETFVISIETSSYKKGKEVIAKVGNGIVIRQGDARIPAFNVQALEILREAGKNVQVQDLLLDAGGCEAGIYHALGYRVAGACMPLIAWHNNGALEDQQTCIQEGVHLNDLTTGVTLLTNAARVLANNNYTFTPVVITKEQEEMHQRIKTTFEMYEKRNFFC